MWRTVMICATTLLVANCGGSQDVSAPLDVAVDSSSTSTELAADVSDSWPPPDVTYSEFVVDFGPIQPLSEVGSFLKNVLALCRDQVDVYAGDAQWFSDYGDNVANCSGINDALYSIEVGNVDMYSTIQYSITQFLALTEALDSFFTDCYKRTKDLGTCIETLWADAPEEIIQMRRESVIRAGEVSYQLSNIIEAIQTAEDDFVAQSPSGTTP